MASIKTRIALRNDTLANWEASTVVLMKGEVALSALEDGTPVMKIGDGEHTWSGLEYFAQQQNVQQAQVYQADLAEGEDDITAITKVVGDNTLIEGDMAIVKSAIGEATTYTAYVYNDGNWQAMNGNYNADNVYFDKDLLTTTAIGYIQLSNGQATIPATGKNLAEVWEQIFVKEQAPTVTQPSITVTNTKAGSYEVGSSVTPAYTTTFNAGKYNFGPATGVSAETWNVILRKNGTTVQTAKTTATGTFDAVVLADGDSYDIKATATHTAGTNPKNNKGVEVPASAITAGSKEATSSTITCYRNSFYGTTTTKDALTSATIRGLSKSDKALANGNTFNITLPVGAVRVVFAYPATLRDANSVKDVNGLNAEIKSSFTKQTFTVAGAGSDAGIEYKVYTTEFAEPLTKANTYTVQI